MLSSLSESMAMSNKSTTLTRDDLIIMAILPNAMNGDPDSLKSLGLYMEPNTNPGLEQFARLMMESANEQQRDREAMARGELPEDWEEYQSWRYETGLGRTPTPETVKRAIEERHRTTEY